MFGKKKRPQAASFDPEKEKPVIRCSICTGEQVAGFRNKETGVIREVMLIRNEDDYREFLDTYGIQGAEKIY